MKHITLILLISLFSSNFSFSQKSKKAYSGTSESAMNEYDYYETLRLERKEKKIKTITRYTGEVKYLSRIEYYDSDGNLTKIEAFSGNENPPCKFQEVFLKKYSGKRNLSGKVIYFECNVKGNEFEFNEIKPSYFYNIGFDENLTEEVLLIFDTQNKLKEKIFVCPDCGYSENRSFEETQKDSYDTVKYIYEGNKVIKEVYEDGRETLITYGANDLPTKDQFFDEYGKGSEQDVNFFEYDFFGMESDSQINEDNLFTDFFELFKTAILNQNKTDLETLTDWSVNNGGIFSIDVHTKSDFMKNVYDKLFNDFWKNAISLAEMEKTIQSQFGQISFSKINPIMYGYSENVDVYVINNCGNGIVFKKINKGFKLVSMLIINEED